MRMFYKLCACSTSYAHVLQSTSYAHVVKVYIYTNVKGVVNTQPRHTSIYVCVLMCYTCTVVDLYVCGY